MPGLPKYLWGVWRAKVFLKDLAKLLLTARKAGKLNELHNITNMGIIRPSVNIVNGILV